MIAVIENPIVWTCGRNEYGQAINHVYLSRRHIGTITDLDFCLAAERTDGEIEIFHPRNLEAAAEWLAD